MVKDYNIKIKHLFVHMQADKIIKKMGERHKKNADRQLPPGVFFMIGLLANYSAFSSSGIQLSTITL
jgi:hypothetical protein